jgi:hypothetical protein
MVRLAADERPLVQPFSAVPIGLRLAAVMKPSSDMLISKISPASSPKFGESATNARRA